MPDADRQLRESLLQQLRRDAGVLADRFRLPLRSVDAERRSVKRRHGICYSDGSIKIRLHHARSGRPLKYSSLVDTLCHELAHLRHFNHGLRFQQFYRRLLEDARRLGLYRPAPRRLRLMPPAREDPAATPPPVQLELF